MRYVILIVSLVFLAYLVMDFNTRTAELNRLRAEQEVIDDHLDSREATKQALVAQIAYATSEAAVNRWAYENHYAKPGDYLVVPAQVVTATPAPPVRPVVTQTAESNFERWLSLFIDFE